MNIVSIAISVIALALGIYNFWWTQIRVKHAFYFVRTQNNLVPGVLTFVLVNGGNQDLLVTSIELCFEGAAKGSKIYPGVRIEGGDDGKADLIQAGRAVEFRTDARIAFTPGLAEQGRQEGPQQVLRWSSAMIEISWVDMSGAVRNASLCHSEMGFRHDGLLGEIRPAKELNSKHDLFAVAT